MELLFEGAPAMAQGLKERFELDAAKAIAARGRYVLALTGGSAAATLYPSLADASCDWGKVHVFFGDERKVPADHADCNLRAVRTAWLAKPPGLHVHPVRTDFPAEEAADDYARELAPFLPFDVVHLGMGPDGHIASLFPGHPLLKETVRTVAWLADSPKPPPQRITVTIPVLHAARALWFLVQGGAKAEAVKSVLKDPASQLPAALAQRGAGEVLWFLDRAAAAQL